MVDRRGGAFRQRSTQRTIFPTTMISAAAYTALCLCACHAQANCAGAAVRVASSVYVCYTLSDIGESATTVLDVASFERARKDTRTCAASSRLDTDIQGLIALIERTTQTFASDREVVSSKVACLQQCCVVPLC